MSDKLLPFTRLNQECWRGFHCPSSSTFWFWWQQPREDILRFVFFSFTRLPRLMVCLWARINFNFTSETLQHFGRDGEEEASDDKDPNVCSLDLLANLFLLVFAFSDCKNKKYHTYHSVDLHLTRLFCWNFCLPDESLQLGAWMNTDVLPFGWTSHANLCN